MLISNLKSIHKLGSTQYQSCMEKKKKKDMDKLVTTCKKVFYFFFTIFSGPI